MHRLSFLCSIFLFLNSVSGQDIFHEESVGWRGAGVELHTLHDDSGEKRAAVLINDDSIRIYLLNRKDSIIKKFQIVRLNGEVLRGGFVLQNKIYLFCGYKQPQGLHNYQFDVDSGGISQNLVFSNSTKEEVIGRFSTGHAFVVLSAIKKTSEFVISSWKNQDSAEVFSYPFTDKSLWNEMTKSAGFSRDMDIAKVDEAGLPGVEVAGSQRKVYLIRDTLFLLLNNNEGSVKIYSFDINNKTVSFRKIKTESVNLVSHTQNLGRGNGTETMIEKEDYKDNSFLLDGKLYFISATTDHLDLSVIDFYTGLSLKEFSVGREDSLSFNNTPVIQDGQLYFFNVKKELTKTRQILRKMLAGNAVIAAINDSLGIALTIGSNKEMQQMGSGGGFMPVGGAQGNMVYMPTGGFSRSGWVKSVRFRMLLDRKSLDHIPGEMQSSINERVELFTKDKKISENAENLLFHEDSYLYIFYDKTRRSLVFARFQ